MPATKYRTKLTAARGFAWDEQFTASAAFTGCPYIFVQVGSNPKSVYPATGGSNPMPIGIIQNAPLEGGMAIVRMFGKSIVAACFAACNASPGTFCSTGSHAGVEPNGASGFANVRWAGSMTLTTASVAYGEVWLGGPSVVTGCYAQIRQ